MTRSEPLRVVEKEAWHARSAQEVCDELSTPSSGLAAATVEERRRRYGRNELPRSRPTPLLRIFLRQFLSPLVYILLAAAAISLLLHDLSDAGFILVVLGVNALIGSVQEYGAERSAQALRALTLPRAWKATRASLSSPAPPMWATS